jgi:hypothetical protein
VRFRIREHSDDRPDSALEDDSFVVCSLQQGDDSDADDEELYCFDFL